MTGEDDRPRSNAPDPMDVIFQVIASNVIEVTLVQLLNVYIPMDVTKLGIVIDVILDN